eukprot:CAMPEP_0170466652 /NCGR_PEP_ID=MMETSP0123-20130129/10528_1 /TAXON_ID=182087 /ORGANISM="Favella ehrenbergii, Strain Fehren 1" /LENGTH=134 /DNA_ID=CAMNT_0010732827 /DNA_START=16 /DNA_END=420 /DNA_ORIENTATION=+
MSKQYGRPDNKEKLRVFIQDSEQPMQYSPTDYTGNKFIGTYSRLINLQNSLFYEQNEKYNNKLNAQRKAELELTTIPKCFDACVQDVTTGLNSIEKNCMRDCYFKKLSSRDDFMVYLMQRQSIETVKASKERIV